MHICLARSLSADIASDAIRNVDFCCRVTEGGFPATSLEQLGSLMAVPEFDPSDMAAVQASAVLAVDIRLRTAVVEGLSLFASSLHIDAAGSSVHPILELLTSEVEKRAATAAQRVSDAPLAFWADDAPAEIMPEHVMQHAASRSMQLGLLALQVGQQLQTGGTITASLRALPAIIADHYCCSHFAGHQEQPPAVFDACSWWNALCLDRPPPTPPPKFCAASSALGCDSSRQQWLSTPCRGCALQAIVLARGNGAWWQQGGRCGCPAISGP